jgi:hypothetical protein
VGEWVVHRDLSSVRRLCMEDLTLNLIHDDGNFVEVDEFTGEEVYRALSTVVDWDSLRPWVVAEARKKRLGEGRLLADVPGAVLELCSDDHGVAYEEACLALYQQGRLSVKALAAAIIRVCGGLAGFVRRVDQHVLVRTPGGLVVEIDDSRVLSGAPRIASERGGLSAEGSP